MKLWNWFAWNFTQKDSELMDYDYNITWLLLENRCQQLLITQWATGHRKLLKKYMIKLYTTTKNKWKSGFPCIKIIIFFDNNHNNYWIITRLLSDYNISMLMYILFCLVITNTNFMKNSMFETIFRLLSFIIDKLNYIQIFNILWISKWLSRSMIIIFRNSKVWHVVKTYCRTVYILSLFILETCFYFS